MNHEELVKALRDRGYTKRADAVAAVTPEDEARLEAWLQVPENRAKWDAALHDALSGEAE